ncbi:hypothetical protein CRE_22448 [Caenorhabditis remanei]|uniref:Uncharacterized protein n=1 Tax=Caenorhabditis remanei TaxID=31234 RepID=E3ME76_CAERE|nr:hypothetical protein CRE_22448 [Caenorhabditis remanei]
MDGLPSWQRKRPKIEEDQHQGPEGASGSSAANQVPNHNISRMLLQPYCHVSLEERRWMQIEEIIRQNEERNGQIRENEHRGTSPSAHEALDADNHVANSERSSSGNRDSDERRPREDLRRDQDHNSRMLLQSYCHVSLEERRWMQIEETNSSDTEEGHRNRHKKQQKSRHSRSQGRSPENIREEDEVAAMRIVKEEFDSRAAGLIWEIKQEDEEIIYSPVRSKSRSESSGQSADERKSAKRNAPIRDIKSEPEKKTERGNCPVRGRSRSVSPSQRAHERNTADRNEATTEGEREPEEQSPIEDRASVEPTRERSPARGPFDKYGTCLPWNEILRQQARKPDGTSNLGESRQGHSWYSDDESRNRQPVQGRTADTAEPNRECNIEAEEEIQRGNSPVRGRSRSVSLLQRAHQRSAADISEPIRENEREPEPENQIRSENRRDPENSSRSSPVRGPPGGGVIYPRFFEMLARNKFVANASEPIRDCETEPVDESERGNSPVRGESRSVSPSQRAHERRAADLSKPIRENERVPEQVNQIRSENRRDPESSSRSSSVRGPGDANLILRQCEMARRERRGDPVEPIMAEEESRRRPSSSRAGNSEDRRRWDREERRKKSHKHKKRRRRSSEGSSSEEGHRKRHKKHRKSRRSRSRERSPRRIRREDEEEAARVPKGPIDINNYIPNGFDRYSDKHPISRRPADLLEIRNIARANNCSLSYDKIDFPGPEMRYIYMRGEEEDIERAREEIDEEGIRLLEEEYEYEQNNLDKDQRTEFSFMYWIRSGCVLYFASEDFNNIIEDIERRLNVKIERMATDPRVLKVVGWNFRKVKQFLNSCCDDHDEPPITKKFTIRSKLLEKLCGKLGSEFTLGKKTLTRIRIGFEGKVTDSLTITGLSENVDKVEKMIRKAITELDPAVTEIYAFTMVLSEREVDLVYGDRATTLTRIQEHCKVEMQMGDGWHNGKKNLFIEGNVDQAIETAKKVRFEASKYREHLNSAEAYHLLPSELLASSRCSPSSIDV